MKLHGGAVSTTTEVWEMLCASRDGDLDHVMQLVSRRPELSTCQFNYTPPLHFAVREGHVALVRMLVSQGAFDPRYKNLKEVERLLTGRPQLARNEMSSWAEGVLMMPAKGGDRPMLELLIGYGAQVPTVSKWGRFYYFKHTDIAAFLLSTGMSARHMNWHHGTLLHDMAQSGDIPKAQLLLDHGADINAIDEEYRSTPLGMAVRWGQRDMVAFLLERGADRERAGAAWSTPLAWAQKKGHISIANDLLGS